MEEEEDIKYNEWISVIRNNPPVLKNPEELNADIIDRINKLPSGNRQAKWLLASGWISTVAATFLICLLLSETLFPPGNRMVETVNTLHETPLISAPKAYRTTTRVESEEAQKMSPAGKYELLLSWFNNKEEARTKRTRIKTSLLYMNQ